MVRPARRMSRAISFGVFCRSAPSTRRIIRSRKVCPCSEVISTTMRSERAVVPPVTADRSPPASRITGADSPVIADSLTDAIPSTTVPSPGIISFASTTTRSPFLRSEDGTASSRCAFPSPTSRRATVSVRARRRASACALPRPSATASAKFAKKTVAQSQNTIWSWNPNRPFGERPGNRKSVVARAPTSTMNMTGFFIIRAGFSLAKASTAARVRIARSSREVGFVLVMVVFPSEQLSGTHQEVLHDGTERESGEERESADDQDHADEEHDEHGPVHRERADRLGDFLLRRERARDAEERDDHQETPEEHREAERHVVEVRVRIQPGESAAVVPRGAREGVEDLGQPVGACVVQSGEARFGGDPDGGSHENRKSQDEHREHRELHLFGLDLLAKVLGSAPDHEARDEDREDDEEEHSVEARADAAENDLAELYVQERHETAQRREGVVHRVHGAARGVGRDRGKNGGVHWPEPDFLAFHVSHRR